MHVAPQRQANKPVGLDLAWLRSIRVNRSATEERAADIGANYPFKKDEQVGALLRIVSVTDLTTLKGSDSAGRVERLVAKAMHPVRSDILEKLGFSDQVVRVGAVCVYHHQIAAAKKALKGSGIPVAAVSAGFPHGQSPLATRLEEIRLSVEAGADEIDTVLRRELVLTENWPELYRELCEFRDACGPNVPHKAILGVGDLGTLERVAQATAVVAMAGADWAKTSTGILESSHATLPVGLTMARQIRFAEEHYPNLRIGLKAAGGIRTAKDGMGWLALMREELDVAHTESGLFRIGASDLSLDVERQLSHQAFGRYSAISRMSQS